jgi:excisionase family DNA binding protein
MSAEEHTRLGDDSSTLLRPNDVARILAVSRAWVYEAARTRRIPSIRIGGPDGPLRFVPEDVERWLDEARAEWTPGLRSSTRRIEPERPVASGRTASRRAPTRPRPSGQ